MRKQSKIKIISYAICLVSMSFLLLTMLYAKGAAHEILWEDLRVVKNYKRAPQSIKKFNGKVVSIPGFMVPLEGDPNGVTEFLLVPSQGQCMHVPPPPPNQMVHVKMAGGKVKYSWEPVSVKGVFSISKSKNQFGSSLFKLRALKVSAYE